MTAWHPELPAHAGPINSFSQWSRMRVGSRMPTSVLRSFSAPPCRRPLHSPACAGPLQAPASVVNTRPRARVSSTGARSTNWRTTQCRILSTPASADPRTKASGDSVEMLMPVWARMRADSASMNSNAGRPRIDDDASCSARTISSHDPV